MTLILQSHEVQDLLPMDECIAAMEVALMEYAQGIAANHHRVRYRVPTPNPAVSYMANIIIGAVPRYNAAAIRVNNWPRPAEGSTRQPMIQSHNSANFFLLNSLETGELLAIIHDSAASPRVGATSAVATKHLAREDSSTLGLFGSGREAKTHLTAIALVRPLRKVKVYSPNEEHRRSFAERMSAQLEIEVTAVNEPRAVVQDADIVCCATNASEPVFDGRWLGPGQFVITIVNTDVIGFKSEVDQTTFIRSERIFINDKESVFQNRQRELLDPIENGLFTWEKVQELGALVTGEAKGRESPEELLYYKNNTGLGIQFAAAGAIIYQKAREKGIGQYIPSEWFGSRSGDPSN